MRKVMLSCVLFCFLPTSTFAIGGAMGAASILINATKKNKLQVVKDPFLYKLNYKFLGFYNRSFLILQAMNIRNSQIESLLMNSSVLTSLRMLLRISTYMERHVCRCQYINGLANSYQGHPLSSLYRFQILRQSIKVGLQTCHDLLTTAQNSSIRMSAAERIVGAQKALITSEKTMKSAQELHYMIKSYEKQEKAIANQHYYAYHFLDTFD